MTKEEKNKIESEEEKQSDENLKQEAEAEEQKENEKTTPNEKNDAQDAKKAEEEDTSKKKEEVKTIADLEMELLSLKDKLLRNAAEFENYKRRSESEVENFFKYAGERFILRLLPVVDDFERSLEHIEKTEDLKAIKKGIGMVYDKMMKILEEQGVEKIDAEGKAFDFNLHEALMQQPSDEVEPHTVLQEIEKGYLYKDKVLRHTKVIVSADS